MLCWLHLISMDSHFKLGSLSSETVAHWKTRMEKCPLFTYTYKCCCLKGARIHKKFLQYFFYIVTNIIITNVFWNILIKFCGYITHPYCCLGHSSTPNSLSRSRNLFEMISVLWCGALSCWKSVIRGWVPCGHEGVDMATNNTQLGCGTEGPKVCQETTPPHH